MFHQLQVTGFRLRADGRILSESQNRNGNQSMNTAVSGTASAVKTMFQDHARLDAWLKGRGIDGALGTMNTSAVARRPGRVVKRLSKSLGDLFSTPRVIAWDKEKKNVYASAHSFGVVEDMVLATGFDEPLGQAVFQTDLYFRANKEVTEVNASTVSGICTSAISDLMLLPRDDDEEARIRVALTLARIVQTGLRDPSTAPQDVRKYLVPNHNAAMVVVSMPIERIEFDKGIVGRIAVITELLQPESIREEDRHDLEEMKLALSAEGYPGDEKFSELLSCRARVLDFRFARKNEDPA